MQAALRPTRLDIGTPSLVLENPWADTCLLAHVDFIWRFSKVLRRWSACVLCVQGNPQLRELPAELGQLGALKHFSAADCALESVPPELGALPSLQSLSLYGNRLQEVAPSVLQVCAWC